MVRHISTGSFAFAVAVTCFSLLDGGAAQFDNCTNGTVATIGDGQCDVVNNYPSCGFDGGDCCSCTCTDGPVHLCADSEFNCVYPDCGDPAATSEDALCVEEWQGNGMCDENNNTPACNYDGGDCCECSCADGLEFACGSVAIFDCQDPACFDPALVAELPDCTGDWFLLGDGSCNPENNFASCGYDGGDCCFCSCTGASCQGSELDCLDPSAPDEFYECGAPPLTISPCSSEAQSTWVVDGPAQAQALAAAVNCSGGLFEVEWRGNIVVNEPIYVADGTVLTITGAAGSNAAVDGNASTRLFTVVNAALHLSHLNISNGASIAGGAIATAGSTLTFNQTNFIGNVAAGNGGAVFVSDGSVVSCTDETTFVENGAGVDGGAMFVTGGSVVSCSGWWLGNTAALRGGAVRVQHDSSASWSEDTIFAYNTAGTFGGALSLINTSTVSWNAATGLYNNSAGTAGGGLVASDNCNVSWNAPTGFYFNSAGLYGGAVYVRDDSIIAWSGETSTVFDGNQAGSEGGAVTVSTNAHVSSTAETTSTFSRNSAAEGGGALVVEFGSIAFFGGNFLFENNDALGDQEHLTYVTGFGGAVRVATATVTWDGAVTFTANRAQYGGAMSVADSSSVSWNGEATLVRNNASKSGGAFVATESSVSWSGTFFFEENDALGDAESGANSTGTGGAATFVGAAVTWDGTVTFTANRARVGGAVSVQDSSVSWNGQTEFHNNLAMMSGGAIIFSNSTASWDGNTTLSYNTAGEEGSDGSLGGALLLLSNARVVWGGGATEFIGNAADFGSALSVSSGSTASWIGPMTRFVGNSAGIWSTLIVEHGSEVSWAGNTEFVGNNVGSGGAVFVRNGSTVGWTGDTNFTSNQALFDGGAIVSPELDSQYNPTDSALFVGGTTIFSNNTSGAHGGGVALLGGCTLVIDPAVDVSFTGNAAAVAGGAVFVSGAGAGPAFSGIRFESNTAQIGGAVAMFGSGNSKGVDDVEPPNPTTFDGCRFIGNRATTTGGAVDSAAGHNYFVGTTFTDNTAGTGGALRLAGTASIEHCSFIENFSDDGGGPVVSNIGTVSSIANVNFSGNGFDCPAGMFLDYNASGDPFETVCDGCETTCDECVFAEPLLAPICSGVLEHSTSAHGKVTLEALSIQRGYWRATTSSRYVLACYHASACLGGVTGTSDYCLEGYEGPYCAVCSEGYSVQLGFTCRKCSSSAGGIVLAVVLTVVGLFVAVAVVSYVTSGMRHGGGKGAIERLARYIPLQSVKIIIVAWQILTQFTAVANVTYPDVYQTFLDGLDVFNFDLSWILSAGCVVDVDFHDRLLMATIGPIIVMLFLGCTYAAAARIHRGATETLQNVWNKHVFMVLLLTFFVYSTVSSTLFRTFACEKLADGKNYLRSDYRIECDSSKHKNFEVYAGVMILLYTVGIPSLYSVLLFRDRDVLKKGQGDRELASSRVTTTSDLWKPYKPSVFYYEVVECGRRILLAGVVVFIYPNSAAQIAITLMIAFAFVLISEVLAPYASRWETWISRMGHVVVVVSIYVALLLKVDVSDERSSSQRVFEAVLVAVHVVMVLVVVMETFVLAFALRAEHWEDSWPRLRSSGKVVGQRRGKVMIKSTDEEEGAYWEKENPFADHVQEKKQDEHPGTV